MGHCLDGLIEVQKDGVWVAAWQLPLKRESGWGTHVISFLTSLSNHLDVKPCKLPNGLPDDWNGNTRDCINDDNEPDTLTFDSQVANVTTYDLNELLEFNYDQFLIYEDMDVDPKTGDWVRTGSERVCKSRTYRDWISNEYGDTSSLYFDRLAEYAKLLEQYDNVRIVVGFS